MAPKYAYERDTIGVARVIGLMGSTSVPIGIDHSLYRNFKNLSTILTRSEMFSNVSHRISEWYKCGFVLILAYRILAIGLMSGPLIMVSTSISILLMVMSTAMTMCHTVTVFVS